MLFGFSGLGFLGVLEYQGGFGYKMYLSNTMALRTGLMFNYNNDKTPEATGNGEDGYDRIMGYGAEVAFEIHKAGDVAARPRQAIDDASAHWISHDREHNWHCASSLQQRAHGPGTMGQDNVGCERD